MRSLERSSTNTPGNCADPTATKPTRKPRPSEYLKPPPFHRSSRQALRTRDNNQNATSLTSKNSNNNSNTPNTATTITTSTTRLSRAMSDNRPRQPQLSAAAARAANRPPVTAKVATTTPKPSSSVGAQYPYSQQPHAATSPLPSGRRAQDGPALGLANITPRTGTRQVRVESANSTPSGTPNPDKGLDGWEHIGSRTPLNGSMVDGNRGQAQTDQDNKFFYASDASRPVSQSSIGQAQQQPPPPPQQQRAAPVLQKAASFFYANGSSAEAKRTTTHVDQILLRKRDARYALEASAANVGIWVDRVNELEDGGAKARHWQFGARACAHVHVKTHVAGQAGHGIAICRFITRKCVASWACDQTWSGIASVIGSSVPTSDQLVLPKYPARAPQSPEATSVASPPLSPGLVRPAMSMASLLQAAGELEKEDEVSGSEHTPPEVSSPTKSTPSGDPISELVANARRERKVQDLEITNASLEAINRTLERQLRKQTAEIRRYRRLSRAGRLSAPSSRVASAALTEPPIEMSDVSEEESDSEAQDSFHESDLSTDDETGSQAEPMSPNAKMAARRKRDEMRLQLDLTKHQELLIDSQKINQSIKRCMDWTEVLIKEGQKALAYHVRVSDVELGGKVLAPPDEEDEDGGLARREDTPKANGLETIPSITLEPVAEKPSPARDSGIELAPDGG
ncbi:uncharacterized protein J7T54_008391 [Emericellopsis cladophorae]|uniref:Uncharacterized protein n=1 Tax=Emericellopsis cladophorae TaxID=2686198 RepID=A0A9P9Y2U5_9HYPO|nr:uncharacterized protein J7T54_008391 [Emericellopsis cladophorae]KAI6782305.1 hypothetical protein J7T54_008391 [Emericellopsis cladophorae]